MFGFGLQSMEIWPSVITVRELHEQQTGVFYKLLVYYPNYFLAMSAIFFNPISSAQKFMQIISVAPSSFGYT